MMMNWRDIAIGGVLTLGVWQLFAVSQATAVGPTWGPSMAVENISPGQTTVSGSLGLDADTNAGYLEWDGDDDGSASEADTLVIPHGARLTIKQRDATETTCCYVATATAVTTSVVGAQSANTTKNQVQSRALNGGPCFTLIGAGDSWSEVVNWRALRDEGLIAAGVCSAASSNELSTAYSVFGTCNGDAACNDVAGHAASTTCDTTPLNDGNQSTINMQDKLPGVYVACRALAATDVDYWVTR